jgi:uncharacterized RDD family membrane protein YckC
MICPSCKKSGPVSFRCRNCGAELMRGRYREESSPGAGAGAGAAIPGFRAPMPAMAGAGASGAAVADNPYATPRSFPQPQSSSIASTDVLASRGSRLAAALIDTVAVVALVIPALLGSFFLEADSAVSTMGGIGIAVSVIAVIVFCVYQISMLVREGRTLGKKIMHIRIVNYDDGEVPPAAKLLVMRYFLNSALGNIPFYTLVDLLFIFGSERRCIHDYLAGTKVVET